MAEHAITELNDCHAGQDIWVIAAGPSAGYIEPCFFDGKVTIGVNRVWNAFRPDYVVVKEAQILQEAIDESKAIVIAPQYSCGCVNLARNRADGLWYSFEHEDNGLEQVDLSVIGTDRLVVSFSTITTALHLAAYIGAANIILVGHDCGLLDGQTNFYGYPDPLFLKDERYHDFLRRIEPQSIAVRERLKEVYGCNVYSLNPFLNFGLEGHRYES